MASPSRTRRNMALVPLPDASQLFKSHTDSEWFWEHVRRVDNEKRDIFCLLCKAVMSDGGSAPRRAEEHMRAKHVDRCPRSNAPSVKAWIATKPENAKLRRWAWIAVEGNMPLRLFDNALLRAAGAPSRAALQQELTTMLDGYRAELSQVMQRAGNVALAIDAWTSQSSRHFVGIVAHWCDDTHELQQALLRTVEFKHMSQTGDALAQALAACMDFYAITKSVWAIVTDGGANMIAACRQLCNLINREVLHFRCAAHVLQGLVKTLMEHEEVVPLASAAKKLIKHYKSTEGARALADVQSKHNLQQLVVFKPAITRWSSHAGAYKRLLDIKLALTFVSEDPAHPTLLQAQWVQLESLASLLHAISHLTDLVQADQHPTMGLLLGLEASLRRLLAHDRPGLNGACAAASRALEAKARFFATPSAMAANILDITVPCHVPSDQFLGLLQAVSRTSTHDEGDELLGEGSIPQYTSSTTTTTSSSGVGTRRPAEPRQSEDEPPPKRPMFGDDYDLVRQFMGRRQGQPPLVSSLEREVEQFIALRAIATTDSDALQWWKETPALRLLGGLARRVLALPCSAASIERVWSQARRILTDDRSSMAWLTFDKLLFLRCNRKLFLSNDSLTPERWWETVDEESNSTIP